MFFVLSKTVGFLAALSNDLILVGLLGVILALTPWRRAGVKLLIASVVLLAIAGYSPLGNVLTQPLEDRFPLWDASRGAPYGIVVLGGAVGPEISAARHAPQLNEAAERVTAAADLARRYGSAKIVYTGGNGNLIANDANEADQALALLMQLGVPRERIILERRSRNTWENALFTKELVHPQPGQRWLLVTSAAHMPRAVGSFRKAGFPVEPYPVDWRTRGTTDWTEPFETLSGGLARVDAATHEWAGLVAYWLAGKTSSLFPDPAPINRGAAAPAGTRP